MELRRIAKGLAVAAGVLASIASPAPDPAQQSPLWVTYGSAGIEGGVTVPAGEVVRYTVHLSFTVPKGGSGGWTEKLQVIPGMQSGAVGAAITDTTGVVLDEGSFTVPDPAANSASALEAKDFMGGCEAGAACSTDLTLTFTGGAAASMLYVDCEFTARDDTLSPTPLEDTIPVTLTLTPA